MIQPTVVVASNAGPEKVSMVSVLLLAHPGAAIVDDDDDVVVFIYLFAQGSASGVCGGAAPINGGGKETSTIVSTTTIQYDEQSPCPSQLGQSLEQGCGFGNVTGMACDGGGCGSNGLVSFYSTMLAFT